MRGLISGVVLACWSLTAVADSSPTTARAVVLPGSSGTVSLDYLVFDRAAGRLWIPAGDTGSVDAFQPSTGSMTRIQGFATVEREMHGKKRMLGPSSAAVGDELIYAGNRATSDVCAINPKALTLGKCVKTSSAPDGMQYVASTKELWVTTPHESSLTIFDAALQKKPSSITLEGSPEGYAVDDVHGFFYTNLEDKDRTLRINIATRKVVATWKPGCGEKGPRGVSVDTARNLVFVACTDHTVVLDGAHDGAVVAKADTGGGVDNIDYLPAKKQLFVASGADARLTIFAVGEHGTLTTLATIPTAKGARSVVADAEGGAYLINPSGGGILVYSPK